MLMNKEFFESKWEKLKSDMDELIPEYMHGSVERYLKDGIEPGDFLLAVLCNDLKSASIAADDYNARSLASWGKMLCWHFPVISYGNIETVSAWCKQGGWNGLIKDDESGKNVL